MKTRWLVLLAGSSACVSVIAVLGACASDGATDGATADIDGVTFDGGPSELSDGGADASDTPCADCEHFVETCSSDVLCPNSPFDSNNAGDGGLSILTQINVIRGRSASDVWAAGAVGSLAHFDGTSWAPSDSGTKESLKALWLRDSSEVTFGSPDNVYIRGPAVEDAGAPSVGDWNAHAPSSMPWEYSPGTTTFVSAWAGPGAEWLWCATTAVYPGTGTSGLWRLRLPPSGLPEIGNVVPDGVCTHLPCGQMLSIHGASVNALWAVGMTGATIRITGADGDTPTMKAFDSQTWNALHGVWSVSETEAWSVGARGTIRHYTGDPVRWDVVTNAPTDVDLHAVWGSSPSDVWAVGDEAVVLHYDGATWSRVKIAGLNARRPKLTTVWMPAPGHVWIGGVGVILSLGGKP
ncbi:MAG: hypothetical protein BGO98_14070 [Myxococcales bacterium 68-20]|nr:hypothetical protein [Myxococcales bacterium]OJY21096.1 MAG: hypothetical protein BGO98_14070 [Myxococcales bacterium 68-20]